MVESQPGISSFSSDHFGVYAEVRTDPLPGREAEWGLAGGDDAAGR